MRTTRATFICLGRLAAARGDAGDWEDAQSGYTAALRQAPRSPCARAGLLLANDAVCDWTDRDKNLRRLAQTLEAQLKSDGFDDAQMDQIANARQRDARCDDHLTLSPRLARASKPDLDAPTPQAFHGELPRARSAFQHGFCVVNLSLCVCFQVGWVWCVWPFLLSCSNPFRARARLSLRVF